MLSKSLCDACICYHATSCILPSIHHSFLVSVIPCFLIVNGQQHDDDKVLYFVIDHLLLLLYRTKVWHFPIFASYCPNFEVKVHYYMAATQQRASIHDLLEYHKLNALRGQLMQYFLSTTNGHQTRLLKQCEHYLQCKHLFVCAEFLQTMCTG